MKFFHACATVALIGAAAAAPAPLALTEAQRLAIERSPQMATYDAAVAAARGMAAAVAQQSSNPEQREALAERYAREADRTVAQKNATRVEIARETALAWLECHYAEQLRRVAGEQLKSAQAELEGAERMYWAGRLSQAEFYGARSMLAMSEDRASELAHRGRATRIALKRWVGDAADAPLAAPPGIDRILLRPAGLEGDLTRHPDVALLQKREEFAASDVRLARANRQSEPEIALALAARDEARAARDERLRAEVAQTRIMIDEWQHARDRRDRYTNEIVPLARERTQATLVAYRGGKAALADVLAARRTEIEAQMQAIETEREAARMWARLSFALPDALPAPQAGAPRAELAR